MKKRGLIQIYSGDGKGKTTASIGLSVRASGHGWKVMFCQFLKSGKSGELEVLGSLPTVTVKSGQPFTKFVFQMTEAEKQEAARWHHETLATILERAKNNEFDLLVLDEAIGAIATGMIDEAQLVEFLETKPAELEVVLTGRGPSERLQAIADYHTEMKMQKHPYETEGLGARLGIEF